MLHTKHTWRKFKIDKGKFTKTLNKVMGQILREGARVWLQTVRDTAISSRENGATDEGGNFPIMSGEALAALIPLAQYLHVALSVSPDTGFKSKVSQGISEGRDFKVLDDNMSTWRYSFKWNTDVYHFFLNDKFGVSTVINSPWLSVTTADDAMRVYMIGAIRYRLPKIYDYIYEHEGNG